MGQSKGKTITSWVLQVILALLFAVGSSGKLMSAPPIVQMFEDWGLPKNFHLLIGVLELAGAIGLVIPRLAGYAALGLIGVMIGAAGTHLNAGEGLQVTRPLLFLVALAVIVWLRRPWPFGSRE